MARSNASLLYRLGQAQIRVKHLEALCKSTLQDIEYWREYFPPAHIARIAFDAVIAPEEQAMREVVDGDVDKSLEV